MGLEGWSFALGYARRSAHDTRAQAGSFEVIKEKGLCHALIIQEGSRPSATKVK